MTNGSTGTPCIWPKCPKPVPDYFREIRLCPAHASIVATTVERVRREEKRSIVAGDSLQPELREERIYFLRIGSYIKIGWTGDLEKRMRNFPPDSVLLAVQQGTRSDEFKLHKRFAVHRSHGREWYPLVPQILEHVKRVVAEHGEPEPVDFGARPVEIPQPRSPQYTSTRARSGGQVRHRA